MVDRIVDVVGRMVARGKTLVMIEHNLEVVSALATCVWGMDAGRPVASGAPADLWNREDVLHSYLGI
jgi:ABC-type branched-subunit amino acid transport system ATPase component